MPLRNALDLRRLLAGTAYHSSWREIAARQLILCANETGATGAFGDDLARMRRKAEDYVILCEGVEGCAALDTSANDRLRWISLHRDKMRRAEGVIWLPSAAPLTIINYNNHLLYNTFPGTPFSEDMPGQDIARNIPDTEETAEPDTSQTLAALEALNKAIQRLN